MKLHKINFTFIKIKPGKNNAKAYFKTEEDSMKILAIEKEVAGVKDDDYLPYLKAEALKAWELYKKGIIRELYFREDWPGAVLILECSGAEEAKSYLSGLPLVHNKLIDFDIIPLTAYPGFERLFNNIT